MNFELLKTVIQSRGFSYRSLSNRCGFNERYIENMIMRKNDPPADVAYKIAHALGTTVEYLVTGEAPDKDIVLPDDLQRIIDKYASHE